MSRSGLQRSSRPLTPIGGETNFKPIMSYDAPLAPFANISTDGGTLEQAVSELEMRLIRAALTRHNWNISRASPPNWA